MVEFTWKELIFLALTIISVVISIIQGQKKKFLYKPIKNDLVGLFNDIATKRLHYHTIQKELEGQTNPYSDLNALKHGYLTFVRGTLIDLTGIREHVVGALKTMDISDKEIFKASDFGLTEAEKKQREDFFKRSGVS